jgi:hypothetical protein
MDESRLQTSRQCEVCTKAAGIIYRDGIAATRVSRVVLLVEVGSPLIVETTVLPET